MGYKINGTTDKDVKLLVVSNDYTHLASYDISSGVYEQSLNDIGHKLKAHDSDFNLTSPGSLNLIGIEKSSKDIRAYGGVTPAGNAFTSSVYVGWWASTYWDILGMYLNAVSTYVTLNTTRTDAGVWATMKIPSALIKVGNKIRVQGGFYGGLPGISISNGTNTQNDSNPSSVEIITMNINGLGVDGDLTIYATRTWNQSSQDPIGVAGAQILSPSDSVLATIGFGTDRGGTVLTETQDSTISARKYKVEGVNFYADLDALS